MDAESSESSHQQLRDKVHWISAPMHLPGTKVYLVDKNYKISTDLKGRNYKLDFYRVSALPNLQMAYNKEDEDKILLNAPT